MKRIIFIIIAAALTATVMAVSGCTGADDTEVTGTSVSTAEITSRETKSSETVAEQTEKQTAKITTEEITEAPSSVPHESTGIVKITDSLSSAVFSGDYGFEEFLASGGAKNDAEVFQYLNKMMGKAAFAEYAGTGAFACSAVQFQGGSGYVFGRNFDWDNCSTLILTSYPSDGYASVSTVNTDFITKTAGSLPEKYLIIAAHYAPLDGMNEKGLCISVNMLPDGEFLNQSTDKPDLQITTAIRLILNRAATTDEAIELLKQYDLHHSYDSEMHYMIADATGKCVCVEYINNEMYVINAKIMTNFYLAKGELYGKGKEESKKRYEAIVDAVEGKEMFTLDEAKKVMAAAKRSSVLPDQITQWTVIYDQKNLTSDFYYREDYASAYQFTLFN